MGSVAPSPAKTRVAAMYDQPVATKPEAASRVQGPACAGAATATATTTSAATGGARGEAADQRGGASSTWRSVHAPESTRAAPSQRWRAQAASAKRTMMRPCCRSTARLGEVAPRHGHVDALGQREHEARRGAKAQDGGGAPLFVVERDAVEVEAQAAACADYTTSARRAATSARRQQAARPHGPDAAAGATTGSVSSASASP